jgi:hypothetical protein
LNIPEAENPPFYARINDLPDQGRQVYHNDDWAVVVFYRDPDCVPTDFNLLEFFDFTPDPDFGLRVFACPLTIEGFVIWETGPGLDPTPFQVNLHGLGAVPIWFVSWPEMQTLLADDILTIGELSSAASLQIGSASFYHETLHPPEAAQVGRQTINATGSLEDEPRFQFQAAVTVGSDPCCSSDGKNQEVRIRFR